MNATSACLIVAVGLMIASLLTHSTHSTVSTIEMCGGGTTIRGIRLSNQSNGDLRFSKIGLYRTLDDATQNKNEWLEQRASSVSFYTQGVAGVQGTAIDMASSRYDACSNDHYVALRQGDALLIDLNADVSVAALRLGAVESSVAADQRRLLVETSARYTDIATAVFVAGYVRFASGPASTSLSRSGLYQYAATPTGFEPIATRSASQTIAPGAQWVKQARAWVRPERGIDNPSDLTYSPDESTLTISSPSCNGPWPWHGTMQFSDFAKYAFTGDFTLIFKFTNAMFGMFNVFSSPTLSLDVLSMVPNKTGVTAAYPYEAWIGSKPGFASVGADCGLMLAGYANPENLQAFSLGAVFSSSPTTQQLTGRIGYGITTPGTFYVRFVRSGNVLTPSTSADGKSWTSTPHPTVLAIAGGMDQMNPVNVPSDHKVMIGFAPYDWTQGNAPLRSITLSCPFQFPTSATFKPTRVVVNRTTTLTVTTMGHDTTLSATCVVYVIANDVATSVGRGTLATTGTATVACTFATAGEFDLALRVTSGAGLTSGDIVCLSVMTVDP